MKVDRPFDAKQVKSDAHVVETLSRLPWEGFTPGTERGDTKAKEDIWFEEERFNKLSADLESKTSALSWCSNGRTAGGQVRFCVGFDCSCLRSAICLQSTVGAALWQLLARRFRELLVELVQAELPVTSEPVWQCEAKEHFLGGALFQVLAWWLGHNRSQTPQEIEALFNEYSRSVLTKIYLLWVVFI